MTIADIQYTASDKCIKVYDSYDVSKKLFDPFLNSLRSDPELSGLTVLIKRTNKSMSNEWACHNFFYIIDVLGLFHSRTKDVDMQYPLSWWEKILYPCLGWFCKIWIK